MAPRIVPKMSLPTDLPANLSPIPTTTANAKRVTRVAEWNGYPWMRLTIGLDMSQTARAVGSIHLLDFQNAAPQKSKAATGEKLARSGWLAVMMRNTIKIVATSMAAIQGRFIEQNIKTLLALSKDILI